MIDDIKLDTEQKIKIEELENNFYHDYDKKDKLQNK